MMNLVKHKGLKKVKKQPLTFASYKVSEVTECMHTLFLLLSKKV